MEKLITIKEVSRKTKVSECAIRNSVADLLALLPVKERVAVMEYMLYCRELKHRKVVV